MVDGPSTSSAEDDGEPLSRKLSRVDLKNAAQYAGDKALAPGEGQTLMLKGRPMSLRLETPQTAARVPHINAELSGLEDILWDSFIEDDWEGMLHLVTLTDDTTRRLAGLIFWQALEAEQVEAWNQEWKAERTLTGSRASVQDVQAQVEAERARAVVPIRRVQSLPVTASTPDDLQPRQWIKINLVSTDPAFRGCGVGKTLVASALVYSAVKEGKNSAVLEVAGGESNAAANRLYSKFGFESPPRGFFKSPELPPDELRVLWDIHHSLRTITATQWPPVHGQPIAGAAFKQAASRHRILQIRGHHRSKSEQHTLADHMHMDDAQLASTLEQFTDDRSITDGDLRWVRMLCEEYAGQGHDNDSSAIAWALDVWQAYLVCQSQLEDAFSKYNVVGSGVLNETELQHLLTYLNEGIPVSDQEARWITSMCADSCVDGIVTPEDIARAVSLWYCYPEAQYWHSKSRA